MSDTINSKENTENSVEITKFDPELNNNGAFDLINKTYVENLEKGEKIINDQFEYFLANKAKIKNNLKISLKNAYQENTLNIEENLKSIEEDFSKVDTKNDLEVKRLKQRLEQTTSMLENKDHIKIPYNQTFTKFHDRFKRLKLEELLNEKFTFDLSGENYLGWSESTDAIMVIPDHIHGSYTYKSVASTHTFECELTCKVRIIEIESGRVGDYFNYGFGLIKADSNNQDSYYNDSVVLQSNGCTNTQFSGSSNTQTTTRHWRKDDLLEVSRDNEGNVYFSINDEDRVKCFSNINFNMKVVMGFSSGIIVNNNQFEMIECVEKFFN
jgi:hypothetical protein